jgi:hypothetical protein
MVRHYTNLAQAATGIALSACYGWINASFLNDPNLPLTQGDLSTGLRWSPGEAASVARSVYTEDHKIAKKVLGIGASGRSNFCAIFATFCALTACFRRNRRSDLYDLSVPLI